jgi:hypothetical protein
MMRKSPYAFVAAAHAQPASCRSITGDRERLACYDAREKAEHLPKPEVVRALVAAPQTREAVKPDAMSELEKRWELCPDLKRGAFKLLSYRPLYALVHATSNTNDESSSPTRSIDPAQVVELGCIGNRQPRRCNRCIPDR